jgi:hypothetical protein
MASRGCLDLRKKASIEAASSSVDGLTKLSDRSIGTEITTNTRPRVAIGCAVPKALSR